MTQQITTAELQEIEALVGTPPILSEITPPVVSASVGRGGYDGASRFEKQIAGWVPPLHSADLDILPDKEMLDTRTRDVVRNDAYIQGGVNIRKDSVVGAFYILNSKPMWELLGKTEEWAEEFQREVEQKFTLWAESPMKWVDASRQNDFTSLIRLGVGMDVLGGEVLATAEWSSARGREYRTCVQMIDPDRLRTPDTYMHDKRVRGGIRRAKNGEPLSAYIRVQHPSDYQIDVQYEHWFREVKWRKPWGREQVIFLREQQRPDQTRAVSAMAAGLREVAITRKFRDVTLQKAVLAATYAATIESEMPSSALYEQLGASVPGSGVNGVNSMVSYAQDYLVALNQYVGASKNMLIDGVKIPHLFPGTKLNMVQAGNPAGVGQEFEQSLLRYIAALLGVSYEELARDYTKTNYSSARAAMATTSKYMASRKRLVADALANSIFRLWLEEAINNDKLDTFKASESDQLYTDGVLNTLFDALANCDWIGAARAQIDELKETQAAVLRIKYGLSTHEDELSRLGKDWRKVYAQLERETEEREKRGIVLLEDNSVNAASGSPREQEDEGTSADSPDE